MKSGCRTSEWEEGYKMSRRKNPVMSGCQVFEIPQSDNSFIERDSIIELVFQNREKERVPRADPMRGEKSLAQFLLVHLYRRVIKSNASAFINLFVNRSIK